MPSGKRQSLCYTGYRYVPGYCITSLDFQSLQMIGWLCMRPNESLECRGMEPYTENYHRYWSWQKKLVLKCCVQGFCVLGVLLFYKPNQNREVTVCPATSHCNSSSRTDRHETVKLVFHFLPNHLPLVNLKINTRFQCIQAGEC